MGSPNQREEVGKAIMVPRGRREGKLLCPHCQQFPRDAGGTAKGGESRRGGEAMAVFWVFKYLFGKAYFSLDNSSKALPAAAEPKQLITTGEVPAVPIEPSPLKGPAMRCLLGKCRTRNIGTNSLCWPALCTHGSTHGNLN